MKSLDQVLGLLHAPAESIRGRSSYNLAAMSFPPAAIAASMQQETPAFHLPYAPGQRQAIADRAARRSWGWQPEYDLAQMARGMLALLRELVAAWWLHYGGIK